MTADRVAHARALVTEIIWAIESDTTSAESVLLRVQRLALAVDDEFLARWVGRELNGYPIDEGDARVYLQLGDRILPSDGDYIGESLPKIESLLDKWASDITALEIKLGFPFAPAEQESDRKTLKALLATREQYRTVRACVRREVHEYLSRLSHTLLFGQALESIFDAHRRVIDELLQSRAGEALDKVPSILERLARGDREATSQAMTSCRRMITAFADAVQPPGPPAVDAAGKPHALTNGDVLNRLTEYLKRCASRTRAKRLDNTLRDLWSRVNAAVHDEIEPDEARSLLLGTYLALGETLAATAG